MPETPNMLSFGNKISWSIVCFFLRGEYIYIHIYLYVYFFFTVLTKVRRPVSTLFFFFRGQWPSVEEVPHLAGLCRKTGFQKVIEWTERSSGTKETFPKPIYLWNVFPWNRLKSQQANMQYSHHLNVLYLQSTRECRVFHCCTGSAPNNCSSWPCSCSKRRPFHCVEFYWASTLQSRVSCLCIGSFLFLCLCYKELRTMKRWWKRQSDFRPKEQKRMTGEWQIRVHSQFGVPIGTANNKYLVDEYGHKL